MDLASLARTFTIRASEGFLEVFAAAMVAAVTRVAPFVRLRFAPKPNKDAFLLRDGAIDLEIGVLFEHVENMLAPAPVKTKRIGFAL